MANDRDTLTSDTAPPVFCTTRDASRACGVATLRVTFFSGEQAAVTVVRTTSGVRLVVAGDACELSRAEAASLREALGNAIARRRAFVRTVGVRRADGSYVVSRRRADSDGNRQVFDSFAAFESLYDRLPTRFDAETVGSEATSGESDPEEVDTGGVTGSRRHLLVRHFAEHPAFDCSLVGRRPLVAEKGGQKPN